MLLATYRRIIFIALVALCAGCSGQRQYQMALESMRAEMLAVEDRYYNLEHEYRIQQAELERYRERYGDDSDDDSLPDHFEEGNLPLPGGDSDVENASSILSQTYEGSSRSGPGRGSDVARRQSTPRRGTFGISDPVVTLPSNAMSADEFMKLLEGGNASDESSDQDSGDIPLTGSQPTRDNLGSEHVPAREISDRQSSRGRREPDRLPSGANLSGADTSDRPIRMTDTNPTHLVINPLLTRGRDFDGADGDDGFAVVVETRNADDLFVPAVGELVISLLDPAEQGEAQRIGIWHFAPDDVARMLKDVPGQGRGINVVIDFPDGPPRHRKLKLFVRFIDEGGRRLESSSNLNVAIPGDGQTGWSIRNTPRSRGRESANVPQVARDPMITGGSTGLPPSMTASPPIGTTAPTSPPANPNRPQWSPNR